MAPGPLFTAASSLATILWLQACAAPASVLPRALTVNTGERVRVALSDDGGAQICTVQTASSGSRNQVYSDPTADGWTKVLPDQGVQQLLDLLAAKGLFEHGSPAPIPGARDMLLVEAGDRLWCWARQPGAAQQQALAFLEAKSYFLTAWNQAVAYSSAAVRKEDLEAARARARQGAEAAKRKLRRLQGTPK